MTIKMINKKPILIVFAFVLAIVLSMFLISSCLAASLDIGMNYQPHPTKPGQATTLVFTVDNNDPVNYTAKFSLDVDDPFSLASSQDQIALVPALGSTVITYNVYVSGTADSGTERVKLKYEIANETRTENFDIEIAPQTVDLGISNVKTTPETVKPGEQVKITISLDNNANADIKNVDVKLDLSQLPFAPVSSAEKTISQIDASSEEQVAFDLNVLASAALQIYKIPVTLIYYDSFSQIYTKQNTISLNVFAAPELEVSIDANSLVLEKDSKLALKVLNKGIGDSKFVNVKILGSGGDYILGQDEFYIGKIDSDNYETIDLQLKASKQDFVLPIQLDYKDINNKDYSSQVNLNVKAYTVAEAKQLGLIKTSPWLVILTIIIVIVIIVIVSRLLRKKRQKQFEK